MLSFAVYSEGKLATSLNLAGAYALGSEDVPLRAEISFKAGIIQCAKRAAGPAGLALLWNVRGAGEMIVETVRLQERKEPYILQVELTRGRLMRIAQKLEDWGAADLETTAAALEQVGRARDLLIKSLKAESPEEAAEVAEQALGEAVAAGEALTCAYADYTLARRRQAGAWPRRLFGCTIPLPAQPESVRPRIVGTFDFATVPFAWRDIEPSEQTFQWKALDAWVEQLSRHRMVLKGSALLSFNERCVPDWLFIWEHDFDTIRDLAFEHVRRVVNRYGQYIQVWDVISGIHAQNCFTFNFEQLMELTRMTAALTKQTFPRSVALVDIVAPWGEYYSRNQRTIPPLLYADMVVQSGINFDGFGVRFQFGPGMDGWFMRDLFQISSMLDQFGKLGRPVHVTAAAVPSAAVAPTGGESPSPALTGGSWRRPWAETTQAEWLRRFYEIALSKPFVESISWAALADVPGATIAHGGLLRSDLAPKPAYQELTKLRSELSGSSRRG